MVDAYRALAAAPAGGLAVKEGTIRADPRSILC
jgi:hypothetical protein